MKNNSTLIKNLLSDYRINSFFQNISLMLIGSLILAFSSKVQVPFWPVPMTMQTFAVFIIGMTYGSKLAFLHFYFTYSRELLDCQFLLKEEDYFI